MSTAFCSLVTCPTHQSQSLRRNSRQHNAPKGAGRMALERQWRIVSCGAASSSGNAASTAQSLRQLDDELSKRPLELDGAGYFIIFVDKESRTLVADHYGNTINEKGLACDPRTGEVIPCDGKYKPPPPVRYRGRTAKELAVEVFEKARPVPVSRFEHAAYLGREFQRAEHCMLAGAEFVQD